MLRRGELIPLAVSSARRLPGLDEVPTFQELGYPDLVATNWYGLSAPKRLPASIATRMSEAIAAVIDDPVVQKRFATFGFELDKKSPEEFSAFVRAEVIKWAPLLEGSIAPRSNRESNRAHPALQFDQEAGGPRHSVAAREAVRKQSRSLARSAAAV
jgi:Tripartite tricarboxylate transporter family receptor